MNTKLDKIKNFRLYLLKQIDNLTTEQLNHIPSGYNNNIIWNLAHLVSAEQTMCYVRSGLPVKVEDKYFTPYISGTKPFEFVNEQDVEAIKAMLIASLDRLQTDLDRSLFVNYTPSVMIPKVYGFEVNNIEEALEYLLYHDGYHAGYIMLLKHRLVFES
jgi:hypothetical protein